MRQQSIDQGASLKGVPRPWGSTASSVLPGSAESLLEPSILPVPKGGGACTATGSGAEVTRSPQAWPLWHKREKRPECLKLGQFGWQGPGAGGFGVLWP